MGCGQDEATLGQECLEKGYIDRFPVSRFRRAALETRVKYVLTEDIHCICKIAYDAMIKCSSCKVWFHGTCIKVDQVKEFVNKKWLDAWLARDTHWESKSIAAKELY